MTKKEKDYIAKQLLIIKDKTDEDALRRYGALLGGARLNNEVREHLVAACTQRHLELNRISPMAAHGDIDDIN